MPICPNCEKTSARRRNGKCPNCGVKITLYKGHWFDTEGKHPAILLLEKWESLLSDRLEKQFFIPRKSNRYKSEMVHISNLLEYADNDVQAVSRALEILFTDSRFSWKTYASVIQMWNDFPVALTLAQDLLEREREKRRAMERQWKEIDQMEDLFE